jgi:hypothetical protein
MALNGYQLFVRHGDRDAVQDAIRDYVRRRGSAAVLWPDDDESDAGLDGRAQRTFALAPPTDGWITVWEDGLWADRLLAEDLSRALKTEAIWLQLTEVTGKWAFAIYRDGKEVDRGADEPDDPYPAAQRFATEHELPFAFEYLPDPRTDEDDDDEWLDRFEAGEFDDLIDKPLDELPEDEVEDEEEVDEEEEEELEPGPELESVRGDLREFTVDVG